MTATGLKEASRVILGGECEARNKALDSAILTHQRSESRKKYAYYHLGVSVNNTLFNPRGSAISETKLDVVPLRRRVRVPIGGRVMNAMEWYLVVTAVIDGTNGDNGAAEEETSCIDWYWWSCFYLCHLERIRWRSRRSHIWNIKKWRITWWYRDAHADLFYTFK